MAQEPRRDGKKRRRRRNRSRPVPKWLETTEMDEIARARCLMVLSVLSGEKPVTDAIAETKISRGTYYQMETRALHAMLSALNPLAAGKPATEARELRLARKRIEELETQIELLNMAKRRAERLLLLTRKSAVAPVKTGRRGRPPKVKAPLQPWIPSGRKSSPLSTVKATPSASSIPTKDGASES